MTILNITEAANRLKTTASQIRYYIKYDNDFPFYAYGSKSYRFKADELDKWFTQQRHKPIPLVASEKKASKKAGTASVIPAQA